MVRSQNNGEPQRKRRKLQQSIWSMFHRSAPKFVEAVGVQLVCRYCNRKFRAPQGLSAHLHMHERAGDQVILHDKLQNLSLSRPASSQPVVNDEVKSSIESRVRSQAVNVLNVEKPILSPTPGLMTRRFTVAEKLRIIDYFNESKNISATCRWVQREFQRNTFARKSLRSMISRESNLRNAIGTKKVRKTVRRRTGCFPRMDKALAK